MAKYSLSEIIQWTGGVLTDETTMNADPDFAGVCTDTRELVPGSLFIALRGPNFDGHDFLGKAILEGAAGLVAAKGSDLDLPEMSIFTGPVVLVEDTLLALQAAAAGYRQTLSGRVLAITGSVGKTSTRQMVAACLGGTMPVHLTSGNLNNEIGLPLTLLQAEPSHRAIILEMGMRALGEIRLLSQLARPDVAMITNVGFSHIGRLGSREAILAAKTEIIDGLRPGGLLILNADDPLLHNWGLHQPGSFRLVWVSTDLDLARRMSTDAAFTVGATDVRATARGVDFSVGIFQAGQAYCQTRVHLPFPGHHHVLNMLFGLACAWDMDIPPEIAAADATAYEQTGNRQRLIEANGVLIMDDSYNASPESMQAALRTLAEMAEGRRMIAALGGMLELGEFSAPAHRELGRQAAHLGFSALYLTGPYASDVVAGSRELKPDMTCAIFPDTMNLAKAISDGIRSGDCVLVKGSRGFTMEQVTAKILEDLEKRRTTNHDI
ncbi:MAG: UDP-N-acetylmuramoyl-tripeptide--D-alanyl-D-alanine ligase [Clostridiaceae bacterium]|jgi:UDP-N-acetylmuramoyl-tripeptide--D-alanyl-D-alanine ligase|nr:UDP-N-acetylmuramoyl-tripeptide--D-alanyl-D-alanine ligase [Clostridiaceae bacterium]